MTDITDRYNTRIAEDEDFNLFHSASIAAPMGIVPGTPMPPSEPLACVDTSGSICEFNDLKFDLESFKRDFFETIDPKLFFIDYMLMAADADAGIAQDSAQGSVPGPQGTASGPTATTGSISVTSQNLGGYFIITSGSNKGWVDVGGTKDPDVKDPDAIICRDDWYLAGDQVEPTAIAPVKLAGLGGNSVSVTLGHSYGVRAVEDNPKSELHKQLITIIDDDGKLQTLSGVWFQPIRAPK